MRIYVVTCFHSCLKEIMLSPMRITSLRGSVTARKLSQNHTHAVMGTCNKHPQYLSIEAEYELLRLFLQTCKAHGPRCKIQARHVHVQEEVRLLKQRMSVLVATAPSRAGSFAL